jgi:hypothetical protein
MIHLTSSYRQDSLELPAIGAHPFSVASSDKENFDPSMGRALREVSHMREELLEHEAIKKSVVKALGSKVASVGASVSRLGPFASAELRENLRSFHQLLFTASRLGQDGSPVDEALSHVREQSERLVRVIDRDIQDCVRAVVASINLDSSTIRKAFLESTGSVEAFLWENLPTLLSDLVTTGKSQKEPLFYRKQRLCKIKVRLCQGEVQVLARKRIGGGAHKKVYKVAVLAGPGIVDRFGAIFAYAKPAKGNGVDDKERHRDLLQHEFLLSRGLQLQGARQVVPMFPLYHKRGDEPVLKGAAMPLYVCGDLRGVFNKSHDLPQSPEQRKQLLCLAKDVAIGLYYLHLNKVVHGDVKPENILIAKDDRAAYRAFLGDFGLHFQTKEGQMRARGTPPYIAPEMFRMDGADWTPTTAIDMWAFAFILAEISFGPAPSYVRKECCEKFFSLAPAEQMRRSLGVRDWILARVNRRDPLQSLIAKLLEIDPNARPDVLETVRQIDAMVAT